MFIQDTTDFIKKVSCFTNLDPNMTLVTMDVSSLYTNIPTQMGIQITRESLELNTEYNKEEIDFICVLLSFKLYNNYFMYVLQFYLQTTGTAMGSKVAPTFAFLFMNWLEEYFVYNHEYFHSHVKAWYRYIDDVFFIWLGTLDSLDTFHG